MGGAAAAAAHAATTSQRLPAVLRALGGLTAAPTPLEEQEQSVPITPEQRPQRERVKTLAQEEQERAALQVSPGSCTFVCRGRPAWT